MQLLLNIIFTSVSYLLLSHSYAIIYPVARFFHVAHAFAITLGGYLLYLFSVVTGLPFFLSLTLAVLITAVVMLCVQNGIYRPLRKTGAADWQMLVVSLGVYVILENVLSIAFGDDTRTFRTWPTTEGMRVGGGYVTDVQLISLSACVVSLTLSWIFFHKTTGGNMVRAVSSNRELAGLLGISVNSALNWSIMIGSMIAALTGILISSETDLTPDLGFQWYLYAVVVMIIAGRTSILNLFAGSVLLSSAQHAGAYFFDSRWMDAIGLITLIALLYFKPHGFGGIISKKTGI